jgi:RHS repeat-associated protein
VDELRFMPVDCTFAAFVYDPASFRTTATIDGAGQCTQIFHDNRDNSYLAVGPGGQVQGVALSTYARSTSSTGAFQSPFPNVTLSLDSAVGGAYESFNNPASGNWAFTNAAAWDFAGGKLVYSGSEAATATCTLFQAPNQAARVSVTPATAAGASVALGNGTYAMRWTNAASGDGTGAWTLEQAASGTPTILWTNSTAGFDSEWLFASIDGMVVAYAGPVQLFGSLASTGTPSAGAITLAATGASSFDDLAILQDPSLSLSARDGMGRPFSSLALLGYQPGAANVLFPSSWVAASAGTFYDALGRPAVSGQALNAPLQVTPALAPATGYDLIPQDQTTYLYSSQGSSLSLSAYLNGVDGFPFTQATFEASPLDRLVNVDAPRGAFTAGSVYCTVQTLYGSSSTVGDMPSAGAGAYRVVTRQALQQTTAAPSLSAPPVTILEQTTTDTAGRLLMRQSGPAGGALLQTGYGYNAAGQLSTIYLPNSYAPPAGTVAADWQESLAYDFLGRRISQTTPDSGTTQWAYDSLNRVRFIYTPNGAPVSPATTQTILYRKYDALDRIVESGYLRDSRYAWGGAALTAMLDVAAFPIIAGTPGGADQAAGMVSKATVFDTDVQLTQGPSFTQFLIGRPTQVTITPTDGAQEPDLETYTYDASGNVLTKTVLMPALSPPSGWTTAYTYDAGNRVLSVTYPPMTATAADPDPQDSPIAVGYGYDRLGRLAAVGGQATGAVVDPENPPLPLDMSYAGYAYDTFGHLVAAQYNNGGGTSGSPLLRSFSYDADERLASIADPYFSQTLTYDASSTLTGWSYFQSKVSTATSAYPGSALAPQPLPGFVQSFGYDGYGRLSSAQNSLGAAFSLTLGNGTADYDANGNILGMTQGASQNTYLYTPPAQSAPCNQVTGVSTSAVDDVDFTASPPALNGWSWASNNGGPSTSALTTTTPVQDGTQALKLAGGSAGHYEVLSLATFLTPGVSYLLTWSAATDSAYPVSPGIAADGACWYAVLNGPSGAVAVAPLGTVAGSSTAWLAGTLTLDLTPAGISRMTGTLSEVVWVSIELRNLCAGSSGAAGAAVYLKSAGLANAPGSTVAATYSYDPLGHVIAAPGRNLAALTYDPCTGLTASISIEESAATASTLAFVYGANNLRSRATLTPSAGSGGSVQRTLTVMGAHGELLATQTLSGGTVTATYYVNGVEGRPFAVLSSASPGAPNYLLTDRLGSLRAVVNGASGTLLAATDTQPFGAAQRTWGTTGTDISYTGQRRDAAAGLYNYNARLYDPALGRFLATDPAGQYASPYAYVGNDPVNAIDPTGEIWLLAQVAVQIAFILPYLLVNGPEFYGEVLRPLFLGIAKEHAETINTDPLPGEGIFGKYWRNVAKMSLKAFLQTIKNVSMKEMQIMADYDYEHWWLNPFKRLIYLPRALDTMVNAYRHIPKDVSGAKSWEKPPAGARYVPLEMANAARHVSFMCRNMRTLFGSPGYALALGDAHEGSGGSSTDLLATLDTISDKLNNAIAIYLTQSYPAVACVELFTENWWGGGGIFSLNNEGRDLTVPALLGITTGRVFTGESFQRSMDYLNNNGVALPAFTSKETAVIDNAMGRLST